MASAAVSRSVNIADFVISFHRSISVIIVVIISRRLHHQRRQWVTVPLSCPVWCFFLEARMASTKRSFPYEQEQGGSPSKKANEPVSESETLPSPRVVLNPADCDLDFSIERDGLVGHDLYEEGFSYCWSGARANIGITGGKYCFGCKIVSKQRISLCRLGVSGGDDTVGSLGESKNSFCISSTGKIWYDGVFLNYCDEFCVGDTIVCCIDLESKPMASIGFSKNGIWLGTPHQFDVDGLLGLRGVNSPPPGTLPWLSALFPHVLLNNITVEMQFSVEDGLVPQEGFKPWALTVVDGNGVMGPICSHPKDCEVVMMVGLPASGKTTWAQKCVKNHPEKRYVLLGIDLILDKMKVPELLRRDNDDGVFDDWMDRATEILNRMLTMVATIPRNYIIDLTNVYLYTRMRRLKRFADFKKIAVVVFPKLEERKRRSEKRFNEIGKAEQADKLKDMIAKYALPKSKDDTDEYEDFDQVIFAELDRDESQKYLDEMKRDVETVSYNESLSKG